MLATLILGKVRFQQQQKKYFPVNFYIRIKNAGKLPQINARNRRGTYQCEENVWQGV